MDKTLAVALALVGGCASTAPTAWGPSEGLELSETVAATSREWGSGARAASSPPVATIPSPSARRTRPALPSEEMHRNEVAIAIGEIYEAGETGVRIGFDYERRAPEGWNGLFDEKWGVGAMIDLDRPPIDSVLLAAQFVYHPVESVGLVLAPGYIVAEGRDDSWVLRLGSRYAFPLAEHFTITPEIFYDIVEGGQRKGVLAVAFGYGF